MPSTGDAVIMSAFLPIFVLGVAANTAICLTVYYKVSLRTPMYALLVNLAVADMLVLVSALPRFVLRHIFTHPTGSLGDWLCAFFTDSVLFWISGAASAYTLISIACERFYAVLCPLRLEKRMTWKKLRFNIICCWSCAIVYGGISAVAGNFDEQANVCIESWPSVTWGKVYPVTTLFITILIPVGVFCVLYGRLVSHLWRGDQSGPLARAQIALLKSRKKVTVMVIAVGSTYALCWMPNVLIYVLQSFLGVINYASLSYDGSVVLVCVNATIDPFLYCLHNRDFLNFWKSKLLSKNRRMTEETAKALHPSNGTESPRIFLNIIKRKA